jgi:hypothetical protein
MLLLSVSYSALKMGLRCPFLGLVLTVFRIYLDFLALVEHRLFAAESARLVESRENYVADSSVAQSGDFYVEKREENVDEFFL